MKKKIILIHSLLYLLSKSPVYVSNYVLVKYDMCSLHTTSINGYSLNN